jgi:hypothetical protein
MLERLASPPPTLFDTPQPFEGENE